MVLENGCYKNSSHQRCRWVEEKEDALVCKTCSCGFPNTFPWHPNFDEIYLQNHSSPRAVLAFFKVFKPSKRKFFLVFQMPFRWNVSMKWCILHHFSFARLLPLFVFWSVFLWISPSISSHSTLHCLHETKRFPFITQHFDASSQAFSCKKHG